MFGGLRSTGETAGLAAGAAAHPLPLLAPGIAGEELGEPSEGHGAGESCAGHPAGREKVERSWVGLGGRRWLRLEPVSSA